MSPRNNVKRDALGAAQERAVMTRFRALREERKLAREDIKALTGVTPEALRLMEEGRQRVRLGVFLALCAALKLEPEVLLDEEED